MNVVAALTPVVEALEKLRVAYHIGGSVASSLHGTPRSTNDVLLRKLQWFRAGGEMSDRQWRDVLGVMRAQAGHLDQAYLDRWAPEIEVDDLLARARREVAAG